MNDAEKTLAELSNITATIERIAELKASLSPTAYRTLIDRLYQRKRIVCARLRSLRPVTTNDLRSQQTRGTLYEEQ
jgi:hypothetical protein